VAKQLVKLFILISSIAYLSGCITKPEPLPAQPLTEPVHLSFSVSGKLGIRGDQISESARFNWTQNQQTFDLALIDPFGRQVMRLTGNDHFAKLETDDQQSYVADSAESLMQELLGWQLPVNHALYWIQGRPDPRQPFVVKEPGQFLQNEWQISTLAQTTLSSGKTAPRKLKMSHTQLDVTLIISDWQFPH
jgi:outer membrane lipoprotein LolB